MKSGKKKYPHKCETQNCRGVATKAGHSPYCARCRDRRFKAKFPLKYSFNALRKRAKERGHEFTLTYEFYEAWAIKTEYDKYKGKTSMSLSIDRIDNIKGYSNDNIQCISLVSNSRKQYVPFFANQLENQSFEPDAQDIALAEAKMAEALQEPTNE